MVSEDSVFDQVAYWQKWSEEEREEDWGKGYILPDHTFSELPPPTWCHLLTANSAINLWINLLVKYSTLIIQLTSQSSTTEHLKLSGDILDLTINTC